MIDKEIFEKILDEMSDKKQPVLKTGFQDLDAVLSGLEKSSLITIGSRPSMGKTSFMINIMLNILEQNKKCLFFSLENSVIQIAKRLIVQISEVEYSVFNNKSFPSVEHAQKLADTINKLAKYDLTIKDNVLTLNEIKANIEKYKPEFVFIDYLQLIEESPRKPHSECYEKIMKDLKQIAKENDCIIFITSQISRKPENRTVNIPKLHDLKGSDTIENISDIVLLLYRDDYYHHENLEDAQSKASNADIIVAKNKYGPYAVISVIFKKTIMKFCEKIKPSLD